MRVATEVKRNGRTVTDPDNTPIDKALFTIDVAINSDNGNNTTTRITLDFTRGGGPTPPPKPPSLPGTSGIKDWLIGLIKRTSAVSFIYTFRIDHLDGVVNKKIKPIDRLVKSYNKSHWDPADVARLNVEYLEIKNVIRQLEALENSYFLTLRTFLQNKISTKAKEADLILANESRVISMLNSAELG